jgi:NAD(P)-dependent dehydrogenase (short-subunit alcohol dehydrogenase family)
LVGTNRGKLEENLERLKAEGLKALWFECDLTNSAQIKALADYAASLGQLAGLVHTAGLSPTMGDWQRILAVDLLGTALLLEAFYPLLEPGSVGVCLASVAPSLIPLNSTVEALVEEPLAADFLQKAEAFLALAPTPADSAYVIAKHGVIKLCEKLAWQWGQKGARLLSLSPGIIENPMSQQELAQHPTMQYMLSRTPLGRAGKSEEIASVVAFLCSDAAAFITGCDIRVDGGMTPAVLQARKSAT